MSYLSNYDDLCIHLHSRKIPLHGIGFFWQWNRIKNAKKKHGNISRHRHVYKNNFLFTAIPFYIQEMAVCFPITKQKEPIIIRFISCDYRLCVNASGSVITEIFKFFTLIRFSCLHFGQYSGKFFISVSSRILNRVLLLHTGHKIHFSCCNTPPHF